MAKKDLSEVIGRKRIDIDARYLLQRKLYLIDVRSSETNSWNTLNTLAVNIRNHDTRNLWVFIDSKSSNIKTYLQLSTAFQPYLQFL